MTPLPLGRRRRLEKRVENVWREGGYGPVRTWRVKRPGRAPLAFNMRVPLGMELIEVAELAEAAAGAPGLVQQGVAALGEAATGGVFLVGALRVTKEPDPADRPTATLTVALSDAVTGPPTVEEIRAGLPDDPHTEHEVVELTETVIRITSLTKEPPDAECEPERRLFVVQYLVQTPFGALAIVFSTTNRDMMGTKAYDIYYQMVKTSTIGERSEAQ